MRERERDKRREGRTECAVALSSSLLRGGRSHARTLKMRKKCDQKSPLKTTLPVIFNNARKGVIVRTADADPA